jgi:hypothetical protein
MNRKKLKLALLFAIGINAGIYAQNAVPASGGNAGGGGGKVSYTVGQVAYTSQEGSGGSVNQGVQQAYEISAVSAVENNGAIELSFLVFPNPTTDQLVLRIGEELQASMVYRLYDVNGKLLDQQPITNKETMIPMQSYSRAIYFLDVIRGNKKMSSFKIIKK